MQVIKRQITWGINDRIIEKNNKEVEKLFYDNGYAGGRRFHHGIALVNGIERCIQYNHDISMSNRNNCITILEFRHGNLCEEVKCQATDEVYNERQTELVSEV
jgi:hypothetical protein